MMMMMMMMMTMMMMMMMMIMMMMMMRRRRRRQHLYMIEYLLVGGFNPEPLYTVYIFSNVHQQYPFSSNFHSIYSVRICVLGLPKNVTSFRQKGPHLGYDLDDFGTLNRNQKSLANLCLFLAEKKKNPLVN